MTLKPVGHNLQWPGTGTLHWGCRCTIIPLFKSFADLAGPGGHLGGHLRAHGATMQPTWGRIRAVLSSIGAKQAVEGLTKGISRPS